MATISIDGDTAAGRIVPSQSWVTIDGDPVLREGDSVLPHAPCPDVPSHCSAVIQTGSSWVTIDGIPICRAGDPATCGHSATGSSWVDST